MVMDPKNLNRQYLLINHIETTKKPLHDEGAFLLIINFIIVVPKGRLELPWGNPH
jgi:hypothetical protein